MNVIVCVDKNNGMAFMGKRQSMDCVLREKILEIANGSRLLMNGFSAKQFESTAAITVDESFLNNAGQGDFCIFFPHDIHRPGMAYQDVPTPVKKIVVKVRA